jgi:hypothetical protein
MNTPNLPGHLVAKHGNSSSTAWLETERITRGGTHPRLFQDGSPLLKVIAIQTPEYLPG